MMSLSEAARGIAAQMHGDDVKFARVSTDSRNIMAGDLFVALRGERFDGHDYIPTARAQGAVAVMMDQRSATGVGSALVVEDTRLGLGKLAKYWRNQFDLRLTAITGSNGKTTVKDMLASILKRHAGNEAVLATAGNLNNDIGVPLTLLGLRAPHRYAVVELGMNHPGEIAYLTRLARPDVALVNNATAAHLQGLGSVEAVARAKGEIFEELTENGTAVINADDAYADFWRQLCRTKRIMDFSFERAAAVSARCELKAKGSEIALQTSAGWIDVNLHIPGLHNARNALAAAACALALGIGREAIAAGLAEFAGVQGRQQRKTGKNGAVVIDDTYNANPESVRAAVDVLSREAGTKILVLGDMGELGEAAARFHAQIGVQAKVAGIDVLYTLGTLSAEAAKQFGSGAQHFAEIAELLAELDKRLTPDVIVLVKGSRFMQMERVVERVAAADQSGGYH